MALGMYNGMILIIKKGDWHTVCSHSVCDAERLQSLSPSKKWMNAPKKTDDRQMHEHRYCLV